MYPKRQAVCASDGKLYTDRCRAECADSNLQVWFDCECPLNEAKCSKKCSHMYDEKNKVAHQHIIKEKEYVYFHSPSVHIYNAVHKNAHALHDLDAEMKKNNKINHRQNHLIHHNTHLLQKNIAMQYKNLMMNKNHTKMHNAAASQLNSLQKGQVNASAERGVLTNKLDESLANQGRLSDAHLKSQGMIQLAHGEIMHNQGQLGEVLANQAAQAGELKAHRADFASHRADFAEHHGLLGEVKSHVVAHDAKLDGLIDAHNAHDSRQSGLIADHANTQAMIKEHDQNLANFEASSNASWAKQNAANAANAEHNAEHKEFMAEQRSQNDAENNHMAAQKEHMQLEKIHMVSNNHQHHYHLHKHRGHHGPRRFYGYQPHNHHGHSYKSVDLNKERAMIKKPAKTVTVVLPKGSELAEKLLKKSKYMYKNHAKESYYKADHSHHSHHSHHHHHHGHGHSWNHGHGHGYSYNH